MAHTFSPGSPPASNFKLTLSSLAFYLVTKYEVVTATKVIGEHSHPHYWVGGLTNRGNENGNIIQCPVIKLY